MGYTHYWTHKRRFTKADWQDVLDDLETIVLQAAQDGIELGDWGGNSPLAAPSACRVTMADHGGMAWGFNGIGEEDAHETFAFWQNRKPLEDWQDKSRRGWDFCKTARKAYDVAVTACLCYLESRFPDHFEVSSDGNAAEWQDGLALARRALPRLDNVLTIPRRVAFDSLFSAVHFGGGKYFVATLHTGEICIGDDDACAIVGRFASQEARDWITLQVQHMAEERQRMLPCKVDVLDRWAARKMRTILQTAEICAHIVPEPVEA